MTEDLSAWTPFVESLCAAVGVDPATVDLEVILDLTRVVARDASRPMAPVSAFILGVAAAADAGATGLPALSRRLQSAARLAGSETAG